MSRLELMILSRGMQLPLRAVQKQIAGALDLVVQHAQHIDGTRRITHITSVEQGPEGELILRDVYRYQLSETSGHEGGSFMCTGHQPQFLKKFQREAVAIMPGILDAGPE